MKRMYKEAKHLIFPGLIRVICNADRRTLARDTVTIGDLQEWFEDYLANPAKYIFR